MLDDANLTALDIALRRPAPSSQRGHMPAFTWAELEDALTSIAASPMQRDMCAHLVSATRKQAAFMPTSLLLREILCMAWVIADETFTDNPDVI